MDSLITFLQQLTPNRARKAWIIIDATVVVWSILLLVELLTTLTPKFRLEGERAYLVYNFGATLIWMVASGLHLLDHYIKYHHHGGGSESSTQAAGHETIPISSQLESRAEEQKDIRVLVLEWILAIYFLYASTNVYKQWQKPDEDVEVEIVDTLVNAGSYAYLVMRVWWLPKDDYTEVPSAESIDV
ncbi:unnamed protein product [Cylindrotheca closterium]|uniref:Uncharacterized protein n=1 Tax=Cylindrotheca closterium TaxID=2856 RepID=A0AAD2CM28_9STRA|nr:unnamed protein product [Cylindrotheca closterium]